MKIASTLLVCCVSALVSLGLVMLYSAGMNGKGAQFFLMQSAWCGFGILAASCVAVIDYRRWKKAAWLLWPVAIVLLALVWVPPFGVRTHGASRWIRFAGVGFQPSEVAKLALIFWIAAYADTNQRVMNTFLRGLVVPGLFIVPILALVFQEPDRGATVLLAAVCGIMLLIAGVRWGYLLPPIAIAGAGLAYSLIHDPMRLGRILSWLHPEENKSGKFYQTWQAMTAFGSGGWQGVGLGNGRQKLGFVPEHHTDFIFSVIGEELGLIATLAVLAAFVLLVICGLCIAFKAREPFGLLLGSGITFLIGLQAAINIGVVTGALPNKGLPLPFLSYGGSNLLMVLTSVGLLLSITRHTEGAPEPEEAEFNSNKAVSTQFA